MLPIAKLIRIIKPQLISYISRPNRSIVYVHLLISLGYSITSLAQEEYQPGIISTAEGPNVITTAKQIFIDILPPKEGSHGLSHNLYETFNVDSRGVTLIPIAIETPDLGSHNKRP